MHVFVTGATGFVGSGVCKALLNAGHDVVGLTSKHENAQKLRDLGIKPVVGDMRDEEKIAPVAARVHATITCAQLSFTSRYTKTRLKELKEAEIAHVKAVIAGASQNKRRVIYTSGYICFGVSQDGWTDEKCGFDPPEFSEGGAEASKILLENVAQGKVTGCVIAPGFVYGTTGFFLEVTKLIKSGKFALPGGGNYYWSPIFIEDLANAYLAALEGKADGKAVLVVDDEPMLMRDIMYEIADWINAKRPKNVPKFVAGVFMGGAMVEGVTTSRRCRNNLAKQLLEWSPKYPNFKVGLPNIIEELHEVLKT